MEGGPSHEAPQLFTELRLSGEDPERPILSVTGFPGSVPLTRSEGELFLRLYRARGTVVPLAELNDVLYGSVEGDTPLSNVESVHLSRLRKKLEGLQGEALRFSVFAWRNMGFYLADRTHPELFYEGGDKLMQERLREALPEEPLKKAA